MGCFSSKILKPSKKKTILDKPFEDITKLYTLDEEKLGGEGQFSITRKCVEKSTGKTYACKSILKTKLNSEEEEKSVKRQIRILKHLSGQPNIVEFKYAYEDEDSVHLVMEFCGSGELFDKIEARWYYSEKDAVEIIRPIVNVVQICHFMGVMHRNLKPENFLLGEDGMLKAIDFGCSVFIEEGQVYRDRVGSTYYAAPEVLQGNYGKEADIWSVGVILYILLYGKPPFVAHPEPEEQMVDEIQNAEIDFQSEPWPSISLRAILSRRCLPEYRRIDFLLHKFLNILGSKMEKLRISLLMALFYPV